MAKAALIICAYPVGDERRKIVKGAMETMAEEQAAKKNLLTRAGLNKYEAELHDLKVNQRQMIAEKIKEAREQGDLSENAEYDAAKDEQRDIEARIVELEALLKNVEVVDDAVEGEINVGCRVELWDEEFEEEVVYYIVGSSEANSLTGRISNEAPVGKALLHHKAGDEVSVETEAGELKFRVLNVTHVNEE